MHKNKIYGVMIVFLILTVGILPIVEGNINPNGENTVQQQGYETFDLNELIQEAIVEEEEYIISNPIEWKEYSRGEEMSHDVGHYKPNEIIVIFDREQFDVRYVGCFKVGNKGYGIEDTIDELNAGIIEYNGDDFKGFIDQVKALTFVLYAEPNFVAQTCGSPNDPLWGQQWGPKKIKVPEAWGVHEGYTPITIAVIDSGINYNHEDIEKQLCRPNDWRDVIDGNNNPTDDCGHGTHCAGIIFATKNNNKGIAGVADCSVLPIKVLDQFGGSTAFIIAKGIMYAALKSIELPIAALSMSIGLFGFTVLMNAACRFARNIMRVTLVAAAGNQAQDFDYPLMGIFCAPARFETTIAVGAIDKNNNRAPWSNYGGSKLNPKKFLMAPGVDIISTTCDGGYQSWDGTSMATPFVAGVIALYVSKNYGDLRWPSIIEKKLINSAVDLGSLGYDKFTGYGLVNAYSFIKNTKDLEVTLPDNLEEEYTATMEFTQEQQILGNNYT